MSKKLRDRGAALPKLLWLMVLTLLPAQLSARDFEYTYEGQTLKYTVLDEDAKTVATKSGSYSYELNPDKVGNVAWYAHLAIPGHVSDGTDTYTVTAIGDYAFFGDMSSVDIPNTVTSIGNYAFRFAHNLTSLDIPKSVTTIGDGAFEDCQQLRDVSIPNSVTSIGGGVFRRCGSLSDVIIPNSVTSRGFSVFDECYALRKVACPDRWVNPICDAIEVRYPAEGEYVIEDGCLWTVDRTELIFVPSEAEGEFIIPNSVTSIGDYAFADCCDLTSVDIPNSVINIGNSAFAGCRRLKSVFIPKSVTGIGKDAFINCSGLIKSAYPAYGFFYPITNGATISYGYEDIIEDGCIWSSDKSELLFVPVDVEGEYTLPMSLTTIGDNAFVGCDAITALNVESSVPVEFADNSFSNYDIDVTVPAGALFDYIATDWIKFPNLKDASGIATPEFSDEVFKYRMISEKDAMLISGDYGSMTAVSIPERVVYNDNFVYVTAIRDAFTNCNQMTSLVLPKRLTRILDNAFKGCSGLTKIDFPETLTTIGDSAFEDCSGLVAIELPSLVTTINDNTFKGCSSLTDVALPELLSTIGNSAFEDCVKLENVTMPNGISSIGEGVFCNCSALTEVKVTWPNVSAGTFANAGLTSLELTGAVKSIGENAFMGTKLSAISIPASVNLIACNAFANVVADNDGVALTLEDGVNAIDIDSDAFNGTAIPEVHIGRDISSSVGFSSALKKAVFGNTVTAIPANAFNGNSQLSAVSFGSAIETIGENAFNGCALTELVLPPHVKTIGNNAFAGNRVNSIAIGSEVTEIGEMAFDGSNQLTGVSITALTPPMANNNTFSNYDCPLYVTPGCVETYYNFTRCWYRFSGHDLIPADKVTIQSALGNTANITLEPGETIKLSSAMTPANASLPYIFWRSTNPAFATVDQEGNVTLVSRNVDAEINAFADEAATECKIIAETLYANGPVAEITVKGVASGIEDIIADEDENGGIKRPNDIFTLHGICLKRNASQADIDALAPGLYIIGGTKVLVK